MTSDVTVVIPTIGRPSLSRAIASVLSQTHPVEEIIVVVDTDAPVTVPDDGRIILLRNTLGKGAARCRQAGIDIARCAVIALLDDDDEWHVDKLARQLLAVRSVPHSRWISSSRLRSVGPGAHREPWPRRTIRPGDSVPEYLFRRTGLRSGEALIQTSTLCFPAEMARAVRWDAHAGAVEDEPSWLIRVYREVPDLQLIQVPQVLSTYNLAGESTSRSPVDRSREYIDWGLEYLADEPARVLGDYLCTGPIRSALSAGSLVGAGNSIRAAVRYGRPGPAGFAYALISWLRIAVRRRSSRSG